MVYYYNGHLLTSSKGAWPSSDVTDARSKVTPASLRMASLDVRLVLDEVRLELAGKERFKFITHSHMTVT